MILRKTIYIYIYHAYIYIYIYINIKLKIVVSENVNFYVEFFSDKLETIIRTCFIYNNYYY